MGIDLTPFEMICNIKGVPQDERELLLEKIVEVGKVAVKYWNQDTD